MTTHQKSMPIQKGSTLQNTEIQHRISIHHSRPFSPISLQDILSHSSILGEYLKKSEQFITLNRIVRKNLAPELVPYCRVKSFSDNVLLIATSSPIWGHSLRFKAPELLENLRKHPSFYALKAIHAKVEPLDHEQPACLVPQHPKLTLTPQSASLISEIATGVSSPKLREALLRLSMRHIT